MRRCAFALVALSAAMLVPASSASAREPVLFVHGWAGAAWNWDVMMGRFRLDGYRSSELRAMSYNSAQSDLATAREVAAEIGELRGATGAAQVDLVTPSMGGLSSRYYLKNLGGAAHVDERAQSRDMDGGRLLVAGIVPGDAPGIIVPQSAQQRRRDARRRALRDVLVALRRDRQPYTSVILSGAANTRTGCIGHISMLASSSIYAGVRNFVR